MKNLEIVFYTKEQLDGTHYLLLLLEILTPMIVLKMYKKEIIISYYKIYCQLLVRGANTFNM